MTIASPPDLSPTNGTLPAAKTLAVPPNGQKIGAPPAVAPVSRTAKLITAMTKSRPHISDLIFSPGRLPQVEVDGQLVELQFSGLNRFSPDDTLAIARDLIGDSQHHMNQLEQNGSTDLSYGIPGVGRFRVNVFRQRGTCAIVMRAIPRSIPSFDELGLPKVVQEIVDLRTGLVLMTGPTGSGKSNAAATSFAITCTLIIVSASA
jgi:twitching motility protein PilT